MLFSLRNDENDLKLIVVLHISVDMLIKTIGLCLLRGWIIWDVSYLCKEAAKKKKMVLLFWGKPKAPHLDVINNLTTAWSRDSAVCMFIPGSLLCMPCLYMFDVQTDVLSTSQYIWKFSVLMGHFMSVLLPFMALHELRAAYSFPLLGLLWGLNGLIYTMHLILCPAHGKYTINIFYWLSAQKLTNFM